MARPDLEVIVIAGDGDCAAIGGNHLIHAARRNIGITVIVFNNDIYGMTGGQYSPTTPTGEFGTTAPYGNIDRPFDIAVLAAAAGASYVAKGSAFHVPQTIKLIENGIKHKGFSLIDCAGVCATYYGRKNKKGDAVDMLTWQKENTVWHKPGEAADAPQGKLLAGLLFQQERPEYCREYHALIERVQKGG